MSRTASPKAVVIGMDPHKRSLRVVAGVVVVSSFVLVARILIARGSHGIGAPWWVRVMPSWQSRCSGPDAWSRTLGLAALGKRSSETAR